MRFFFLISIFFSFYSSLYGNFSGSCFKIEYLSQKDIKYLKSLNNLKIKEVNFEIIHKPDINVPQEIQLKEETILRLLKLKIKTAFSYNKLYTDCKRLQLRFGNYTYNIKIQKSLQNDERHIIINFKVTWSIISSGILGAHSTWNQSNKKVNIFFKSYMVFFGLLPSISLTYQYTLIDELKKDHHAIKFELLNQPISQDWSIRLNISNDLHMFRTFDYSKNSLDPLTYQLKNTLSARIIPVYHVNYWHLLGFGIETDYSNYVNYTKTNEQSKFHQPIGNINKYFELTSKSNVFFNYVILLYTTKQVNHFEDPVLFTNKFEFTSKIKIGFQNISNTINPSIIVNFLFFNMMEIKKKFEIINQLVLSSELFPRSYKNFNLTIPGYVQGIVFGKNLYHYTLLFQFYFYNFKIKKSKLTRLSLGLANIFSIGNSWNGKYYFNSNMFNKVFISDSVAFLIRFNNLYFYLGISFPIHPLFKTYKPLFYFTTRLRFI